MIGLLGSDPYWRQLARQEGIELTCAGLDSPGTRVLVVDRRPDSAESRAIARLLESGRGVLTDAGFARTLLTDLGCRETRLRHLVPDDSRLFRGVGIVDIETRGWTIAGANIGRTNTGRPAILDAERGPGRLIVLPFRPARVLADTRTAVRVFPGRASRPIYERVSAVGRGDVRRLVANCWRRLLELQGLPYIHLSYVPVGSPGCFGFRVDTDFGPTENILKTLDLAGKAGLRMSWFINTGAHGTDLAGLLAAGLSEQDVQLHCDEHRVFKELDANRENLDRGRETLERHGLRPTGVASPYGDWNANWQLALEQAGFEYSSDFGLSYDDLPFRPLVNGHPSAALQVPCHPVSPGRLRACRASPANILEYFRRQVELCLARREPALLYGHPGPLADMSELMAEVFAVATGRCGRTMCYTDFARWWCERESSAFRVRADAGVLEIESTPAGDSHGLMVESAGRFAALKLRSARYALDELDWQDADAPCPAIDGAVTGRHREWLVRIRQGLRDRRRRA